MPARSIAELRAMHAAASGKSTLGIPKTVGAAFVRATHGTQHLPERVRVTLGATRSTKTP